MLRSAKAECPIGHPHNRFRIKSWFGGRILNKSQLYIVPAKIFYIEDLASLNGTQIGRCIHGLWNIDAHSPAQFAGSTCRLIDSNGVDWKSIFRISKTRRRQCTFNSTRLLIFEIETSLKQFHYIDKVHGSLLVVLKLCNDSSLPIRIDSNFSVADNRFAWLLRNSNGDLFQCAKIRF